MFDVCTLGLTMTQSLNQYYWCILLSLSALLSSSRTGNSSVKGAIHVNLISIFWRIFDTLQIYIYDWMNSRTLVSFLFFPPGIYLSSFSLSRQTVYYSRRIGRHYINFRIRRIRRPSAVHNSQSLGAITLHSVFVHDSIRLILLHSIFLFICVCVCYRILFFLWLLLVVLDTGAEYLSQSCLA